MFLILPYNNAVLCSNNLLLFTYEGSAQTKFSRDDIDSNLTKYLQLHCILFSATIESPLTEYDIPRQRDPFPAGAPVGLIALGEEHEVHGEEILHSPPHHGPLHGSIPRFTESCLFHLSRLYSTAFVINRREHHKSFTLLFLSLLFVFSEQTSEAER